MLPPGHLAVGYLIYTVGIRLRHRRGPEGLPTVLLAFGTQLPDLIDKPLNWWFDIFDGRAIGHSALVMTIVCVLLFMWARERDRGKIIVALSVGVFSHLLLDSWGALLSGDFNSISFLLWPIFPAPTYPKDSLFDHLEVWFSSMRSLSLLSPREILMSKFGIQFMLFVSLLGVWAVDGFPGVTTTWDLLTGEHGLGWKRS